MTIDTTFDVRCDAGTTRQGAGRDPDRFSPTLRRYHRLLWSKPLPSGYDFDLVADGDAYLRHVSDRGDFRLASDSIVHTLSGLSAMRDVISEVPGADVDAFLRSSYTIGGMILFPADRVDGKPTINGARGMHPRLRDRFDLALECIRLHYAGAFETPLSSTLARYANFFELFGDFRGYVEFFLLQDLVSPDFSAVEFFTQNAMPPTTPLPRSVQEYSEYRRRSMRFIDARNARMATLLK